jgi:uncharacterized protein Smg (DUF494 family)
MISKIVEVLAQIVQGINKNYTFEEVENSINQSNIIEANIVATAYSWVYEKMIRDLYIEKEIVGKKQKSFRILSPDEASIIGLQNYNYLLHYYNIGLLSTDDFNMILEQLNNFDENTMTKDNIHVLILSLFLNMDNYLLPGSRNLLYSSDTIN